MKLVTKETPVTDENRGNEDHKLDRNGAESLPLSAYGLIEYDIEVDSHEPGEV